MVMTGTGADIGPGDNLSDTGGIYADRVSSGDPTSQGYGGTVPGRVATAFTNAERLRSDTLQNFRNPSFNPTENEVMTQLQNLKNRFPDRMDGLDETQQLALAYATAQIDNQVANFMGKGLLNVATGNPMDAGAGITKGIANIVKNTGDIFNTAGNLFGLDKDGISTINDAFGKIRSDAMANKTAVGGGEVIPGMQTGQTSQQQSGNVMQQQQVAAQQQTGAQPTPFDFSQYRFNPVINRNAPQVDFSQFQGGQAVLANPQTAMQLAQAQRQMRQPGFGLAQIGR